MTELEKTLFDVIDLLKGQLKVVEENKVVSGESGISVKPKPRVSQYDCYDCKLSTQGGGVRFSKPHGVYLCGDCNNMREH